MQDTKKVDYCLGFDWIQFNSKGLIPLIKETYQVNENLFINPLGRGTRQYQNIAKIIYYGEEIGEMEWQPHSSILDNDNVMIKLANTLCYQSGIGTTIRTLLSDLELKFSNWTRIDFALDGHKLLKPLVKVAENKQLRLVGKSDITYRRSSSGIVKSIHIGSRCSHKMLCGYHKSAELNHSGKEYIRDWWKFNGLENLNDVERVEIRCKSAELKRFDIFNAEKQDDPVGVLDRLQENPQMFETLFKTLAVKLYEFVDKKAGRTSRAKRRYTLKLKNVGTKLMQKACRLAASELNRMKQAAKTLYWVFLSSGKDFYFNLSKDVAMMVEHRKWWAERMDNWKTEYRVRNGKKRFQFLSVLAKQPEGLLFNPRLYDVNEFCGRNSSNKKGPLYGS